MLVDTINKVKTISFDSSNLDAYVTSLRGLSATQAEVVLSSAGLDKAQKQQILNKLAETNATISLKDKGTVLLSFIDLFYNSLACPRQPAYLAY